MDNFHDFLFISAAAKYLGVSPSTLRNWGGYSSKLPERRHPMNGYRLYAKEELDALLSAARSPVDTRCT